MRPTIKSQHTCEKPTALKPDSIKIAPSLYATEAGTRLQKLKERDKMLRSCIAVQRKGAALEQCWWLFNNSCTIFSPVSALILHPATSHAERHNLEYSRLINKLCYGSQSALWWTWRCEKDSQNVTPHHFLSARWQRNRCSWYPLHCLQLKTPPLRRLQRAEIKAGGEERGGEGGEGGDVMWCARGDAGGGWHRQVAKPGLWLPLLLCPLAHATSSGAQSLLDVTSLDSSRRICCWHKSWACFFRLFIVFTATFSCRPIALLITRLALEQHPWASKHSDPKKCSCLGHQLRVMHMQVLEDSKVTHFQIKAIWEKFDSFPTKSKELRGRNAQRDEEGLVQSLTVPAPACP